ARTGILEPGDDLLFLIVAGDIRENVKPALALLLDRVKSEAVSKREFSVGEAS
ncbi:MAG: molybdenum cofactor biosynthesis protein, partial [Desulfuromonas sp.]